MNIEKIVNSKWYSAFDWIYKLLVMNLLTMMISMLLALPTFLLFKKTNYGTYVFISILLAFYAFIPCYITNSKMIKYIGENRSAGILKEYFVQLWNILKKIYLFTLFLELILVVLFFGSRSYWLYLQNPDYKLDAFGIITVLGYWVTIMGIIFIFFALVHLPSVMSYFHMTTWTYTKASFFMAFKYFFKTLAFSVLVLLPFISLLYIPQSIILVVIALLGFTGPQFLIYKLGRPTYWYLANNIKDIKTEDEFELKGDNDETRN